MSSATPPVLCPPWLHFGTHNEDTASIQNIAGLLLKRGENVRQIVCRLLKLLPGSDMISLGKASPTAETEIHGAGMEVFPGKDSKYL